MRTAHPRLSLELLTGSHPVDLNKGEADLAIRSGPVADETMVARRVGDSGWSLYASPAYLARRPGLSDPNDLRGHEVIGYDLSLAAVPAARWVEEHADPANIVLRSREMTDMRAAALSGAGLAVLPCLIADHEPGLVRLTPAVLASRELWLVYPREGRHAPSVQAVVGFVVEIMLENAARISGVPSPG